MLDPSDVAKRKQLSGKIFAHRHQFEQWRVSEERRLLYVGTISVEDTLLVFRHGGVPLRSSRRGPFDFLCAFNDIIDRSAAAGDPCGVV